MSNSQVLTIQSRRQSKPLNIQPREKDTTSGSAKLLTQQRQRKRSLGQEKKKINQILLNSGASPCVFCEKYRQNQPFSIMVGRALFSKYSASQNYYYSKDINELVSNQRTQVVIRVKDTAAFDEEDEYLNRYYAFHEYDGKIRRLTEYYKFHRDIARMFMMPIITTLNKYHDKKRRIYYIQITKMLKEKEGKKDTPSPPQTAEKNGQKQNSNEDKDKEEHFQSFQLSQRVLPSFDDTEMEMKSLQSNTLQDLNSRLNDILLNSTQNTQSYFYENEASQTIGNLSNFLKHLQKQNSYTSQSSNPKADFFGQIDKKAQFKQGEKQQQVSSISSRTIMNNHEQPEQKQLISQNDPNMFAKKTSGNQLFSSARSSLELIPKQLATTQNANLQKQQNDDNAMQIHQMNQEMIALGILKHNSKVTQNIVPPFDKNHIGSNVRLSHAPSAVVSPLVAQDLSPLVIKPDSHILFKKMATNEALGSSKEIKENSNPATKESTIILAAKESLKTQATFKMAVSVEATKLNSQNQSFEAIKSPLVIQHFKDDDKQHEESSPIKISNTKINLHPINNNQDPPFSQSNSPTKRVSNIGSSQHRRTITSDKNLAEANRKLDFTQINKIQQENLSQQFKLHIQQRQTEEEVKTANRKYSAHEKIENKFNPYSALTAPNTDRPIQPKQNSLQSTLTSREKEDIPKSNAILSNDKNNDKRLKTYEPIVTRKENNLDLKASLHRSKGDPFPQQQDALVLTDRQSILKTNEGKKQSFFNHLSSQGSLLSDEAMSPIKLQNKLSAQSEGVKSQTNLMPNSNQIRSPTLESRVIFDASPQKQSGGSLHVSKSKTTFSTAVLSQSIPSNIKLSQVGNQNNANNSEQRTTETLMRKTRRTKGNKGSINEIPEFQMSQSSSSQQNINPEISSQLNIHNTQGDTVPVRKLNNQFSQKKSISTIKFENLGELKQFQKEVQRRTEAVSQQRDEYVYQKGSITQRVTPNSQQISSSKEISPRIQRLVKQETNSQSSSTLKQVLTERDTSNRRNSTQFKSSSITSSSSTNLLSNGNSSKFPSTIGQIQTISNVQRGQELNNPNKIMQFKQQASKNNADALKTTASSISNLETARKNQTQVVKNSLTEGSSGISPIPGHKQGSFTALADNQLQQYGGQTFTQVGNGNQQSSTIKVIDKIKHSRLNSMGSTIPIYPPVSSNQQTQPLQNKQTNQQGHGQNPLQQVQPQQFITNVNSQFSVGMPNNSNPKKIHHKYTKSETDFSHQNSSHNQVLISSQAFNAANQPISYSTQSGIPNLNINLVSQPQLQQSQSQQLDTKRGMMSLHTQGSQPSSQMPLRGGVKKNSEQQQFVTYANNNVVNIYVNSQDGGTIIQTNNIINNYNQHVHQNIGQIINSQINLNNQQVPVHAFATAKKQMNGGFAKGNQDNVPSFQKI